MTNKICKISLFSAVLACITNMPVSARVNVKSNAGRSYSDAYNQVMAQQQQAYYNNVSATAVTTASDTGSLPVAVDDKKLAESIKNNTSESIRMADLEACSMIYPNGVFRWGVPESGVRSNGQSQCIAVVELRDANTNAVLATTTVAAGDSMKCNIDMFPENGRFQALANVELPADAAPTIEEVENVLNQEQRQGAGFKIAAAAIISGVAGNMLAPKQAGDTKLFGTSKTQLMDTAIGTAAGAGIMAASTYSGKVAGDTIKSTAVNAASGMLVGNMAAGMSGGNAVLSLTKCRVDDIEKDCVLGKLQSYGATYRNECAMILAKGGTVSSECSTKSGISQTSSIHFINQSGDFYSCSYDKNSGKFVSCHKSTPLLDVILYGNGNTEISFTEVKKSKDNKKDESWIYKVDTAGAYILEEGNMNKSVSTNINNSDFFMVKSGKEVAGSQRAYAVFDQNIPHKAFGYTVYDFDSNKDNLFTNPVYYARNADGSVGMCLKKCPGQKDDKGEQKQGETTVASVDDFTFTAVSKDASDGNLIDLSNEARAKATLVGTAAGGALGGFAGYQGAKTEIEQRWTDAIRVYNDSLSNFVCMTGGRFLSQYNDSFFISEMKKEE